MKQMHPESLTTGENALKEVYTMSGRWNRGFILYVLMGALIAAAPSVTRAQLIVEPGFDLFETNPGGTQFAGFPFEGVPIGTFDFGDGIPRDLGDADTIVQRLDPAIAPALGGNATVSVELVALQLRSAHPIDLGAGLDFHYATLSDHQPSGGFMDIFFETNQGGFYFSQMQVNFDIRLGALNGPIIFQDSPDLFLDGAPWRRDPPAGARKIPGINYRLATDGSRKQDFWGGHGPKDERTYDPPAPCQPHGEAGTFPATHCINTAPVPPKPTKWSQRPGQLEGENIPSDVDWRVIMQPPSQQDPSVPNWVVADDFRSDGRPIHGVRWWGSYPDPALEPQQNADGSYTATTEDGFVLSFFKDIPVSPTNPFSTPGTLIGTYTAPIPHIKITPTNLIGWDQHRVWEYEVLLDDTHAEHLVRGLTTPNQVKEIAGEIYWLSVVAENGHFIDNDTWEARDNGDPPPTAHFWGWHTSPDQFNDVPVMGDLQMPGTDWVYDNWDMILTQHGNADMAFELFAPEPTTITMSLCVLGLLCGCRRTSARARQRSGATEGGR